MNTENIVTLDQLKKGTQAVIVEVNSNGSQSSTHSKKIQLRLLEMGITTGESVELVHEAPISQDPIAIRVRGSLIALRRNEAKQVKIKEVGQS